MSGTRSSARGLLALALCVPWLTGGSPDPGLLLEIDRERFELRARDLASGAQGPVLRLVLGSPAHPTPPGSWSIHTWIRRPDWQPGPVARSRGARPVPASESGPLGIGALPLGGGSLAIHGGANPLLLGKPVSLGCARATDADLLRLLAWLDERGALTDRAREVGGELHTPFRRPARVVVR